MPDGSTRARRRRAAAEAPPNIALVKYWGVRDPRLALPFNDSLSVTLARFRSRTSVAFDGALGADSVFLNGARAQGGPREAVVRFLDRVRERAGVREAARVRSANNFPTASGLASSASGFAALAVAASAAAGLDLSERELSQLARFGSGSAARSIYGGYVEWRRGSRPDGKDCFAAPLHPPDHWPELVDLVCVVDRAPVKAIRSATAMQQSVATSPNFAQRQREIPARIRAMKSALARRDAERLFPLIMEECDSFRNVCETTRPALDYLTAASRAILERVRAENDRAGAPIAAYTHDAGAHVHVFTLDTYAPTMRRSLRGVRGVRELLNVRPGPGARPLAAAA